MRVAIFSDIHGNLLALEAVLADINSAECTDLLCLGDICNIGSQPKECLDLVRSLDCVVLQGNHELYLVGEQVPGDWKTNPLWTPVRWTQEQLTSADFNYMRSLPISHELPTVGQRRSLATHATPVSQFAPVRSETAYADIGENIGHLQNTYLFCGHTHAPLFYQWESSYIINPGSVGAPLDGTPHAKYAIATQHATGWHIEFRQVAYDYAAMQRTFITSGQQASNPLLVAAARHQLSLSRTYFLEFIQSVLAYAQERNASIEDIYDEFPVPPELLPYLNE